MAPTMPWCALVHAELLQDAQSKANMHCRAPVCGRGTCGLQWSSQQSWALQSRHGELQAGPLCKC